MNVLRTCKNLFFIIVIWCIPCAVKAQGLGDDMQSLHSVLDQLYDEMMPLCSNLIAVPPGRNGKLAARQEAGGLAIDRRQVWFG